MFILEIFWGKAMTLKILPFFCCQHASRHRLKIASEPVEDVKKLHFPQRHVCDSPLAVAQVTADASPGCDNIPDGRNENKLAPEAPAVAHAAAALWKYRETENCSFWFIGFSA